MYLSTTKKLSNTDILLYNVIKTLKHLCTFDLGFRLIVLLTGGK